MVWWDDVDPPAGGQMGGRHRHVVRRLFLQALVSRPSGPISGVPPAPCIACPCKSKLVSFFGGSCGVG